MLDPRTESDELIIAPHPLPHVSRRALRRVTDWMPPPKVCRYCQSPVVLTTNDAVYSKLYGDWPYIYKCTKCDAHVGLHPHTDLPLGIMASGHLRGLRSQSKAAFRRMMGTLSLDRTQAYAKLSELMGIPKRECHFGWFDSDDCVKAKMVCERALSDDGSQLPRRG